MIQSIAFKIEKRLELETETPGKSRRTREKKVLRTDKECILLPTTLCHICVLTHTLMSTTPGTDKPHWDYRDQSTDLQQAWTW